MVVDPNGEADFAFGYSLAISGDFAMVTSLHPSPPRGYHWDGAAWQEFQTLTQANGDPISPQFVAMDGNTAITDAAIFTYDDTSWTQHSGLTFGGNPVTDISAVALDGVHAMIGDSSDTSLGQNAGAVMAFELIAGTWQEVIKLTATDGGANDWFGNGAVAIEGNYAIVGAFKKDNVHTEAGKAYVFKYDAGAWTEVQQLSASNSFEYAWFGSSVSMSGDYAVIGQGQGNAAYVYYNNAGTWQEHEVLHSSLAQGGQLFGSDVAIDGDYVVVGARNAMVQTLYSGVVFVFQNQAGSWQEKSVISAQTPGDVDFFGIRVAISGDKFLVAATREDTSAENAGAVYFY